MIKRDNTYNNPIIIIDGMWGSGKSLTMLDMNKYDSLNYHINNI